MRADLQGLEAHLGYAFKDRFLLVRALTHRSFSSERRAPDEHPHNEMLEFFGDAVLGFLVSEILISNYPSYPEGKLSKLKNRLVSSDCLHQVAQHLDVGSYLHLGRGEEMGGGRQKRSLLADSLEAIIAAVYLDGGLDPCRQFVSTHIVGDALNEESVNFEGELEERVHTLRLPRPRYVTIEELGPGHAKLFTVEARVGDAYVSRGTGSTKKSAAQTAARLILDQMSLAESDSRLGLRFEVENHPGSKRSEQESNPQ